MASWFEAHRKKRTSADLQALYEALWAPIGQALPSQTKRIIISPDGQLNFISFATLLSKDKQFLAEKYDVQYVASGRDLLRELKPSIAREVVLFANPDFGLNSTTTMLAKTRRRVPPIQAQRFAAAKRGHRRLELWEFEGHAEKESDELIKSLSMGLDVYGLHRQRGAQRAALLKIHSPYILHLATHGFFGPRRIRMRPGNRTRSAVEQSVERDQIEVFHSPMHRSGPALAEPNDY